MYSFFCAKPGNQMMENVKKTNNILSILTLSFGSLGSIYGDIGTSPLYVFSTIFKNAPSNQEVHGGASCIFWLFTIVVIAKYALIVLTFGTNNNEGGQIAIYSKIARTLKFGPVGVQTLNGNGKDDELPVDMDDLQVLSRVNTIMSSTSSKSIVTGIWKQILSNITLIISFLGCSLVISDGILTPTTSVLSAVAGIAVASPEFSDKVMPVSCAILVVLFMCQRFGSGKITMFFSPIILIWLLTLLVNGIMNISKYNPGILKCLNPYYAVEFLKNSGGIDTLSGVMLAVTGTEAMFADVSHFGALPIQLTLGLFVYPCLMIAYLGQAAYLMHFPDAISNVFYESIPGGTDGGYYWFILVVATLATIIASQALILGVFSILKQMIMLDFFPRLAIHHTSEKHPGRIFIPVANYVLMVCVILATVGFKNSNNVTAAYGLGISIDFLMTTTLITICLIYVYKFNIVISIAFFLGFGALDTCLIGAGLTKVPHGAWFTIMVTFICFSFIGFWHWCRGLKVNDELLHKRSVDDLFFRDSNTKAAREAVVIDLKNSNLDSEILPGPDIEELEPISPFASSIPDKDGDIRDYLSMSVFGTRKQIKRIDQIGLMFSSSSTPLKNKKFIPELLSNIVNSFGTIPKIFILFETRVSTSPVVSEGDQVTLQKVRNVPGFYRCLIRSGFMKQAKLTKQIMKEMILSIDETQDLMYLYGVDDVMDSNEQYTIPIVHIFEKELVVAKPFNSSSDSNESAIGKYSTGFMKYIRFAYSIPRSFLINYLFSPLNDIFNNGSMDYLLPDHFEIQADEDKNFEVLYIGKKASI